MPLPTFIVLGPPRTGTTWLFKCLNQHPDIYLSERKEVRYFDEQFDQGEAWYRDAFADAPPGVKAIGDITPGYFSHPETPQRIHDLLGDEVELFVIIRDPIERAQSAYEGAVRRGETDAKFETALSTLSRLSENSHYARYIHRYLEVFPTRRIHLLDFAELKEDPTRFLRRVYQVLGVPEIMPGEVSGPVNARLPPSRFPVLMRATVALRQGVESSTLGRKLMWKIRDLGLTQIWHRVSSTSANASSSTTEDPSFLYQAWFAEDQVALKELKHLYIRLPEEPPA
jgi:hypothetical protein